jgi:hypothetical protein
MVYFVTVEARHRGAVLRREPRSDWVPRFYRGRLVGFVQREDHKGALRKLAGPASIAGAEADKADRMRV